MKSTSSASVQEGYLHVLVAFDIGFEVKVGQIPDLFPSRARDPVGYNFLNRSFGRDTTPIRLVFDNVTLLLAERQRTFQVYAMFFDIGALSLELICEIDEQVDDLSKLAIDVQNSRDLVNAAQRMGEDIFRASKAAIVTPEFVNTPLGIHDI